MRRDCNCWFFRRGTSEPFHSNIIYCREGELVGISLCSPPSKWITAWCIILYLLDGLVELRSLKWVPWEVSGHLTGTDQPACQEQMKERQSNHHKKKKEYLAIKFTFTYMYLPLAVPCIVWITHGDIWKHVLWSSTQDLTKNRKK
jgi:hypothetical protein